MGTESFGFVAEKVKKGNDLYAQKNYEEAGEKYKEILESQPESDIINFNLGTALYQTGDYKQAREYLKKSLLSDQEGLIQKANYNLGNSYYKEGFQKENKDISAAIELVKKSLEQYKQALILNEKDGNARYNLEFVQKELERLQKKKNQADSQQGSKKDKQKKSDQSKDSQSQEQSSDQSDQSDSSQKSDSQDQDSKKDLSDEEPKDDSAQENQKDKNNDSQDEQNEDSAGKQEDESSDENSSSSSENKSKNQEGISVSEINPQDMTEREAQMLLENYQQTEEPRGMLQFFKGTGNPNPVKKDW